MNKKHLFNSKISKGVILLIALQLPLMLFSQTEIQKDSLTAIPRAIEISEIADYSQETRTLIEETQALASNKTEVLRIQKGLVELDSIMAANLLLLRDTLSYFNLDQLDKLEDRMSLYKKGVNLWQARIEGWREETIDSKKRITFDTEVWQITSDSITSRENRTADIDSVYLETIKRVKQQITSNINNLEAVENELMLWDEDLNNIENATSVSQSELNEAFSLISIKKSEAIDNIWIPEYSPIWELNSDKKIEVTSISVKEQFEAKRAIVKRFVSENIEIYYMLVFSFIVIFSVILLLNIKAKKLFATNPSVLHEGNTVLKYPFWSSIIILSFFIFLFFDVPIELKYIIFLLLIIPFSILIWERNSKTRAYDILLFITSSIIMVSLPIISQDLITLRYALFMTNLLLIGGLVVMKSKKNLIEQENTYWLGALPFLINVFIVFSIVAFTTNIIGSVQLSLLLTRTTLGTLISFVIIKEAVLLVQSFLYLLLLGPLFRFSNILKDDGDEVLNGLSRVLKNIAFLFWFYIILDLLKIRKSFFDAIWNFIKTPLEIGTLSISLGNVLAFFIILQISIWISTFIRYFLDKEIYPRTNVSIGVASTFSLLIKYSITFIGFLFALFGAGVELSELAIGFGALGIGVGFGLKNIINNFVSGIILAIERPIKIGDIVKVDDVEGEVKDIGLRASQIGTWDGSDVLVPNDSLISGKLTNRTFDNRIKRLDTEVQVGVEVDIRKVINLIMDAVKTVPDLMEDPEPYVNYIGIIEGKSVLKVYGWIHDLSLWRKVGIDLKIAVFEAIRKEGIEISAPVIDVTYKQKSIKE
jgi:small-conductance mechanosensitive channel